MENNAELFDMTTATGKADYEKANPVQMHCVDGTSVDDLTANFDSAIAEEEQFRAAEQKQLAADARPVLFDLEKLGFEVRKPDEIRSYNLEIWNVQKLCAEKNIGGLVQYFSKEGTVSGSAIAFLEDPANSVEDKIAQIELYLPRFLEYKKEAYLAGRSTGAKGAKAKYEADLAEKLLADQALLTGRTAEQIKARIKEIEHTPNLWKDPYGGLGLKFTDNELYTKLTEERDKAYLELDVVIRRIKEKG